MRKKIWFYLFCLLLAINIVVVGIYLYQKYSIPDVEIVNASEYENPNPVTIDDLIPENGFIPDAQTAKVIGGMMIDQFLGKKRTFLTGVDVAYDPEKQVWVVQKGYFPFGGATVILDQNTGAVVDIVGCK